jgi:hypothetical protein
MFNFFRFVFPFVRRGKRHKWKGCREGRNKFCAPKTVWQKQDPPAIDLSLPVSHFFVALSQRPI